MSDPVRVCGSNGYTVNNSVNALAIYMAPVRNSDGIITGCPFGEHFNEIVSVKLRQVII